MFHAAAMHSHGNLKRPSLRAIAKGRAGAFKARSAPPKGSLMGCAWVLLDH